MPNSIADILNTMTQVILLTVPTAALLLYFFWNLFQLIFAVNDPEKKKDARKRLIWSIFAFFVVMALAGIVAILQTTLFGRTS